MYGQLTTVTAAICGCVEEHSLVIIRVNEFLEVGHRIVVRRSTLRAVDTAVKTLPAFEQFVVFAGERNGNAGARTIDEITDVDRRHHVIARPKFRETSESGILETFQPEPKSGIHFHV